MVNFLQFLCFFGLFLCEIVFFLELVEWVNYWLRFQITCWKCLNIQSILSNLVKDPGFFLNFDEMSTIFSGFFSKAYCRYDPTQIKYIFFKSNTFWYIDFYTIFLQSFKSNLRQTSCTLEVAEYINRSSINGTTNLFL